MNLYFKDLYINDFSKLVNFLFYIYRKLDFINLIDYYVYFYQNYHNI